MLDNQTLRIRSDKLSLIPYCREHVDTYHEWMKDPYILEMTASEPLSLEEEIEMQQSWALDPKKATFIVVRPTTDSNQGPDVMIGDVNLFFNDYDDPRGAEVDIMIAREDARGQGFGTEAVLLMLHYALSRLDMGRFYCKINETNLSSLRLFRKLGFADVKYVAAFKEHELELMVDDSAALVASIESRLSGAGAPTYSTYDNPAIKAMQAANTQVE